MLRGPIPEHRLVGDNQRMSTPTPWPSPDDEPATAADATREIVRPGVTAPPAGSSGDEQSPWARPAGHAEPYGQPPSAYPPAYGAAPESETRFAGQPYAYRPDDYPPPPA